MASGGERRMVFDTRGRRKHVVRVVYAVLALMMAASLFLVVGPFNFANLLGNSAESSGSAAKVFEEQAERIEGRLRREPNSEDLLLALTRARIGAGNAKQEINEETETQTVTAESRREYAAAGEAWNRYLKLAGEEASPTAAQLVAATFIHEAETPTSYREAEELLAQAARAQKIAAEQRPSLGTLSSLAIYQYFNGEIAGGNASTKQAAARAASKAEGKKVEEQLAEYRKNAKKYLKQKTQANKVEKEIGKEQLANPFSGLGGSAGVPGG